MTRKYSTKNALIASVLLLALCVSMLVGTTYAWFTDSVTSGSNVIKTGNLDIVLEYWDGDSWEDAEGNIIPFVAADGRAQNDILWEPGCTYNMAPIRVRNEGSLNAKILIMINGVTGNSKLLEVIDFKTNINNIPESVLNGSAGNQLQRFEGATLDIMYGMPEGNIIFDWSLAGKGTTTPGTGHTDTSPEFTMTAHMAEEAGNEYMDLTIEGISITVIATQETYESDSFDKWYDKNATFPVISNVVKAENETKTVSTKDVEIEVPAGAPAGGYEIVVSNKKETTDAEGNTTVAMDIDLKKDGVKVEDGSAEYTVSVAIGANKNISAVTHKGSPITEYTYDPVSGIITFTTDSFSPFAFTLADATKVYDLEDLKAAFEEGGTVLLMNDIEFEKILAVQPDAEVYLNMNGKKITVEQDTASNTLIYVMDGAKLVVYGDGTIDLQDVSTMAIFAPYGELVIENGTFIRNKVKEVTNKTTGLFMGAKSTNSKVIINGGYFDAGYYDVNAADIEAILAGEKKLSETADDIANRNNSKDANLVRTALKDNISVVLNHSGHGTFIVYGGTFVGMNPAWGDEGCMLPTADDYLRPWSYYQGAFLDGQSFNADGIVLPDGYTITINVNAAGVPVYTVAYSK